MVRWYFAAVCLCLSVGALPRPAGAQTFSNPSPITVPSSGPASPYASIITVAGLAGSVRKVTVTLSGVNHPHAGDIDVLLVSPSGAKLVLMADTGGQTELVNASITLSDTAPGPLPVSNAFNQLTSGTYSPTNELPAETFPAPAPAVAAGDNPAPTGTATLTSRFAGTNGNGVWSLYIVGDGGTGTGSISGGWSIAFSPFTTAKEGDLLISEFRLRGVNGATDEFIEIYNDSGTAHVVSALSGTGYGVAASDGITRCTIPNGTVMPAGGHFLCVNSTGYSLGGYPAGVGTSAAGDATFTLDIPDNVGIALFNNNTGGGSYKVANVLDAVGSTAESNSLYRGGGGYPVLVGAGNLESSFTRRPAGGCNGVGPGGNCGTADMVRTRPAVSKAVPGNSGGNEIDFIFVNVNGSSVGAGQRIGAPGPENSTSPLVRSGTATLKVGKFEACAGLEDAPNAIRDATPDAANNATFGTLDIRRTITNMTGSAIQRLRFRVVDLTTYGVSDDGVADLRLRTSTDVSATVDRAPCGTGTSSTAVRGTTLEQSPTQPKGGGYNSTLSLATMPIPHGGSVDVRFVLGIQQAGFVRFCLVPEALPDAIGEPFCYFGHTENAVTYTPHDLDNDQMADVSLFNRGTRSWSFAGSGGSFISFSFSSLVGTGLVPVPGDYDGDHRLDVAVYRESTGTWTVRTSSSGFLQGFQLNWGGSGYKAMPGDYDGDGQTDAALYYAPTGHWYILLSSSGYASTLAINWGGAAYAPMGGLDFDGDGKSDLTIYNESLGTWSVLLSAANFTTAINKSWGGAGYTLVPGDYDGDGRADFAIYNRTTGMWYALTSSSAYASSLAVSYGGPGFVPMPADFDGDGEVDIATYQLQSKQFVALKSSAGYALGSAIVKTYGGANYVPVTSAVVPRSSREIDAGDFDGDFASDLTIYNTTTGAWSILKSSSSFTTASTIGWGGAGYTPAPGDYDGDGRMDIGLYQGATGNWLVLLSASNYTTTLSKNAGGSGYIPVPGDYDGDGKTDLVVYNTTNGLWFGLKSSTNYTTTLAFSWGGAGYTAAPGDFDGDGKQDLALYQASTGNWLILTSSSNYTSSILRNFGGAGYVPVQADHDGDGITDFAVYETASGIWTILKSTSGNTIGFTVSYGGPAYTPVAGDWDGDGCADVGVYDTAGNWSILLTGDNYTTSLGKNWGGAGYVPLPAFQ